jgi:hypothetical protein
MPITLDKHLKEIVTPKDAKAFGTPEGSLVKDKEGQMGAFKAAHTRTDEFLNQLGSPKGIQNAVLDSHGLGGVGGLAGTFVGKNSNVFDWASEEAAIEMKKAGKTAEEVWRATKNRFWKSGTRQEISDKDMKFHDYLIQDADNYIGEDLLLDEVISHKDLFKAYPGLVDLKVIVDPKIKKGNASFLDGKFLPYSAIRISPEDIKEGNVSTILHEIQHAIQMKEGWQGGGNVEQFKEELVNKLGRPLTKEEEREAYQLYQKTPGEVEARNSQTRQHLTDEERGWWYPDHTQDKSIEEMKDVHKERFGIEKKKQ